MIFTYKMKKENVKMRMAIASFLASIAFGIAGFYCPPLAIIDSSVLWFTSQLLVFTASLLGMSMYVDKIKNIEKK